MGKIQNMLPKLIMEAMKERNTIKKNAYTNLKTAFLNYVTSKEGVKECTCDANGNKVISDEKELSIIKKMHKELVENGNQYKINEYLEEASYLEQFIPAAASEEDIISIIEKLIDIESGISQKEMGMLIKNVKTELPNADGKTVSMIVKKYVKK